MTEAELQRAILLAIPATGARLFRNNVAEGWIGVSIGPISPGRTMFVPDGAVIIQHPRRLHSGLCVGSSDLVGYSLSGQFLACEVKASRGRLTPEQRAFLEAVRAAGGIGIEARSVDDVLAALR